MPSPCRDADAAAPGPRHAAAITSCTSGVCRAGASPMCNAAANKAAPRAASASDAACTRASAAPRAHARADGHDAVEADARVDVGAGHVAPAAERDHRQADRARVHRGQHAVALARHVAHAAVRAAAPRRPARRAGRPARPPCARSAAPPHRCRAPAGACARACARSACTPPSCSSRALSSSVSSTSRGLARAAAQHVEGLAHLERVAGGAAEHLVHVGDERGGRQACVPCDGHQRRAPGRAPRRPWHRTRRCRPSRPSPGPAVRRRVSSTGCWP